MADTVVVVDDDEAVRDAIAETLAQFGFDVRTAGDGADALRVLADAPRPCVAVVDLVMPNVDGWELMRALGALRGPSRVPVVCVTASRTAVPEGCHAILRKPFHDHELFVAVRAAFASLRG